MFDGIIEDEIYRRFMNREHDGDNEYYQYLVKSDEKYRAEEKQNDHMG